MSLQPFLIYLSRVRVCGGERDDCWASKLCRKMLTPTCVLKPRVSGWLAHLQFMLVTISHSVVNIHTLVVQYMNLGGAWRNNLILIHLYLFSCVSDFYKSKLWCHGYYRKGKSVFMLQAEKQRVRRGEIPGPRARENLWVTQTCLWHPNTQQKSNGDQAAADSQCC